MSTLAERLASWSDRLRDPQLPPEVAHEVKRRVIDSFACALGAYDSEPAKIARAAAHEGASSGVDIENLRTSLTAMKGSASVLGTIQKTSPDLAAFANGTMVRYLDFNDTYLSKEPAHPSDNIPACIAVAESEGRSGKDLILAIAIAYEVQCRLCDAASIRARGWDHVTYGSTSSTLAAAKLMGLSVEQTVHALGIAGTTGNYLRQTRAGELSMWKAAAFAAAARNAVFSASLAKRGMTGPAPIFEGQFGFWNEVSGPFELPALALEEGDRSFKILDTYIKRWPVEYHAQSGVDAALQLRRELPTRPSSEQHPASPVHAGEGMKKAGLGLRGITIRTFDACVDIIADPTKWNPTTRESADHSLPYCVAVALIDGDVTMESFSEERIRDPNVRALMDKIQVIRDPECNAQYPEGIPNDIVIDLGGFAVRKKVVFPRGHAKNPMSDEEVEDKFRTLATRKLTEQQIDSALARLWRLDEMQHAGEVMEPFVGLA